METAMPGPFLLLLGSPPLQCSWRKSLKNRWLSWGSLVLISSVKPGLGRPGPHYSADETKLQLTWGLFTFTDRETRARQLDKLSIKETITQKITGEKFPE